MQPIHVATDRSLPSRTDATASSIAGGQAYLADIAQRLARYFVRSESRQRVMAYVRGLLREAERKNSWHVAEACGAPTPYGFQYLLARADWDADMVRDELCTYLIQHLGDPHGVLVLDETGVVKKGPPRPGSPARTPGRSATWRTAKSACCWAMPVRWAMRWWIANCIDPKSGRTIERAAGRRGSLLTGPLPPSRRWPASCWPEPSRPACRPIG